MGEPLPNSQPVLDSAEAEDPRNVVTMAREQATRLILNGCMMTRRMLFYKGSVFGYVVGLIQLNRLPAELFQHPHKL